MLRAFSGESTALVLNLVRLNGVTGFVGNSGRKGFTHFQINYIFVISNFDM